MLLACAASLGLLAAARDGGPELAWREYGRAAFSEAARSDRPVVVVLRDDACACVSDEDKALADQALQTLLRESFVPIAVSAASRPDLADLAGLVLTVLEAQRREEGSTVLVFAPSGGPFAARHGVTAAEDGDLRTFLYRQQSEFRRARPDVQESAARVVAALRRAQQPSGPPAEASEAVLSAAVRNLRESGDASRSPAARLLLLAHYDRTGDARSLLAARREPVRAARGLAEAALRLEANASVARVSGDLAARQTAVQEALRLVSALPEGDSLPGGQDGTAADLGVIVRALAVSAQALETPALLAAAEGLAARALQRLGPARSLVHHAGSGSPATLDDHAHLAFALLTLDEANGNSRWRAEALSLAETAIGQFADVEGGAFFMTPGETEPPGIRVRNAFDGRLPSGNATLVRVLLRLADLTGEARYRQLARRTLDALVPALAATPRGMEATVLAVDEFLPGRNLGPGPVRVATPERARVEQGPVLLEARLDRDTLSRGDLVSARLRVVIAEGSSLVGPAARLPLFGFALSVPGDLLPAGPPDYPPTREVPAAGEAPAFAAFQGECTIHVPLRVPKEAPAGVSRLLLRVRYQACRGPFCGRPETATVAVPFTVLPEPR